MFALFYPFTSLIFCTNNDIMQRFTYNAKIVITFYSMVESISHLGKMARTSAKSENATRTFGSSELKKKNERLHFFSSDLSILTSCCYLKQTHLKACPFKIVTCTNENCDVTVERRDLEQHVTNTCEWRVIECEYCEQQHPKKHMQVNVTKLNRLFFHVAYFAIHASACVCREIEHAGSLESTKEAQPRATLAL